MRIIITKEIQEMYDAIEPYMYYTEGKGWALRPDAPPKIVEFRRKIKEYNDEAKRDAM